MEWQYIQPWRTPFPILSQSDFPCLVLAIASWPPHRFLGRQVRWSGIPTSLRIFQFVVIHTVKGFSIVNEADVFLEFPCFFYDPMDVGNFISVSSAFSKSSLNIWKFFFQVLLKPSLKDFEDFFASMWNEQVGLWRRLNTEELMLLNCGVGEDSWQSLGLQGDPTSSS